MLRVASCLTTQHDLRLVLLAAAVCVLTSIVAINLLHRASATDDRTRVGWLITTGIAAGYGIWATHFIAMLAFSPGLPTGYDLPLTIYSLLAAAVMSGLGFTLAVTGKGKAALHGGGVIVALGIAVMHYTGMSAFQIPGRIDWMADLVIASIVLGCIFGVAAVHVAIRRKGAKAAVTAAVLLALAILSHHFTAMGAVQMTPDPTIAIPNSALLLTSDSLLVAIAVASVATGLLGASLLAAFSASEREQVVERSNAEIATQAQLLETALANMSQGVCLFDADQRVLVANRRYAELYSLTPDQISPGTSLRSILEARAARGAYGNLDTDAFIESGVSGFRKEVSEIVQLADGRHISVLRRPMANGGLVSTHEDITERRQAEARIAHLAHHDVLTDLPNRALLREHLEMALTAMRQGGRRLAVLLLDLDRFKQVNDTLGHAAGDALLKAVAERLNGCVRAGDMVARLGGDEFAIILRSLEPTADSVTLAMRVQTAIEAPFEIDGQHVMIGTSIGIAIAPGDGEATDQLLRNADLALYRSKSDRCGSYHLFEPEMDERMQARRAMEADLRKALQNSEFIMHYQPLLNLDSNEICGFEALLRWKHPQRGNVSPTEFIPLTEETGLIVALGEWVLRQACTDAATWPEHLKIAVNVSPAQFKARNLADIVMRTLAATGMAPERLELEITESAMMQDEEMSFNILSRLHDIGVRIALDDFGTGYSSLSNLRKFPFDKIKIDRSFVADLSDTNMDALAVVRSVAQLGRSLGMITTAEGVETREQFDQVREEGCTEAQGFYISRPGPALEIEKLILPKCRKSVNAA
ncbi:MAG: EAL domain-containing protein [Rhodomicrobiaceae bacterium]